MHIGFTGTQLGMSPQQIAKLTQILTKFSILPEAHFHHGDCIGADAEAHDIAHSLGFTTHSHPPVIYDKRAFTVADITHEPKHYLARNRDIVHASTFLIAAPKGPKILRSGTWYTVRWATHIGILTEILPR